MGILGAIAALGKVLEQSKDEDTRWWVAESLGKIGQGNQEAIAPLVKILVQTEDKNTRRLAAESLGKIDAKCLSKIAQSLSYPDFYQAWHGSLPSAVNLAEFPQLLRAALPEQLDY